MGCGLLFGVERCGDDRIAEHGDHFDDVRDGDADGAGLDEAVAVSKVQVARPVEDRGDACVLDGV